MFKSIYSKIALMLVIFSFIALATNVDLTTMLKENTGGIEAYKFTFTNTAAQDSVFIVPSDKNHFNSDDMSDVITLRYDTAEATADSVRWNVYFQARIQASDTWFTVVTFVDTNSIAAQLHVIPPLTYGKWPLTRFVLHGAAANNALQLVTGQVTFDRD